MGYPEECIIGDIYSASTTIDVVTAFLTAHFTCEEPTPTPGWPCVYELPVCSNSLKQYNPAVSGDIVVWEDLRNGNYDIYGYNLTSSSEFPVCTQSANQYNPAVSGDIVVWRDYRNGNGDIYGYNLSSSDEFLVCNNSSNQYYPAVSGDIVVWEDYRNGNYDIYGYDLSSSTEFPICTYLFNSRKPDVSGDIVVWLDYRYSNWDVYGYDLSSSTEFSICTHSNGQETPAISGDIVVWADHRNGNWDIYARNLSSGTEFPVCTQHSDQKDAAVSGDVVVWEDTRMNYGYDIYGYNISSATEITVCGTPSGQFNPATADNIVVWQDNRNGISNTDIYGAKLRCPFPGPTPTPTASPTQSTTPMATPMVTATPTATGTPTPTATGTATPTPTLNPEQWHTFYGSSNASAPDSSYGIAVDSSGNIYVTARSYATWNGPGDTPPLNAHSGDIDIVVVKLDGSGAYQWHTFYGSAGADYGYGIAVDSAGNVYVTGKSDATWGSPLNAHAGGGNSDIVVVKLNGSGAYQWHTFHGSKYYYDSGVAIAVDSAGNVYVTGDSAATWGSPIDPHVSIWGEDIVVAKLNSSGALQWNTFHGSNDHDRSYGIAVDPSGNVYVTGWSTFGWGTPINACKEDGNASGDIVVFKLNNSGALQWNTFHGSWSHDWGLGIAADSAGNAYVAGYSLKTWGSPLNAHAGGFDDIVVAKLNSSGAYQWHTFHGSSSPDTGRDIAVDPSGNVYVTGRSEATWGSPVSAHAGDDDIVVAKLNSSGALQWNTFYGSSDSDVGTGIAVDSSGNVYVTGASGATWNGTGNTPPLNAYAGGQDIVVVKSASVSGPTPTPTPTATGTPTATATATATATPTPTSTPLRFGDANADGDISITDLAKTRGIILGTADCVPGADSNTDGCVSLTDIARTRSIVLGTIAASDMHDDSHDFSSGAGTTHVAYYKQVLNMPTNTCANESGWTAFSGGNYSAIAANDSSDFSMPANASAYNAIQCRFSVNGSINASAITDLGVAFNGTTGVLEVWAWNFDTMAWSQIELDSPPPNAVILHTTADCWGTVLGDYIDGSDYLYILFIQDTLNQGLDADYLRMELAYP